MDMGMNYYLKSTDSDWVKKYFGRQYEDYGWIPEAEEHHPDTATDVCEYVVHLNKKSIGWEPLFQWHPDAYKTFEEMRAFLHNERANFTICNEEGMEIPVEIYINMCELGQQDRPDSKLDRHTTDEECFQDSKGYSFTDVPFS